MSATQPWSGGTDLDGGREQATVCQRVSSSRLGGAQALLREEEALSLFVGALDHLRGGGGGGGGEAAALEHHPALVNGFASEARRLAPDLPAEVDAAFGDFVKHLESKHGLRVHPPAADGPFAYAPFCDDMGPQLTAVLLDRAEVREKARTDASALVGWRVEITNPNLKQMKKVGVVVGVASRRGKRTKCVFRPDDKEWVTSADGTAQLDLDRKDRGKPPYWGYKLLSPDAELGGGGRRRSAAVARGVARLAGAARRAAAAWRASSVLQGPFASTGEKAARLWWKVSLALLASAPGEELARDAGLMGYTRGACCCSRRRTQAHAPRPRCCAPT